MWNGAWTPNATGCCKSRIPRIVPVWPDLTAVLRGYDAWLLDHLPDGLTSKFIIVSSDGPTPGSGLSRSGLDSMWEDKIRTLPGLARVTRHQCRHTFASELMDAGVDRLIVQGWMGHDPAWGHRQGHPNAAAVTPGPLEPGEPHLPWQTTDHLTKNYRPGGSHHRGDSSVTIDLSGLPSTHRFYAGKDGVRAKPGISLT